MLYRSMAVAILAAFALVTLASPPSAHAADSDPTAPLLERMRAGEYAEAEAAARETLARLEARWCGGKATEPETREICERSLAMKERLYGPTSAGVGKTQHHLAIVTFFGGGYDRRARCGSRRLPTASAGWDRTTSCLGDLFFDGCKVVPISQQKVA